MKKKWSKRQEELIKRYREERKTELNERNMKVLEWDPDFFEHYLNFSAHPWKKGVIPPKYKEFIYIAIDAAVTHLYLPGLGMHIRRALERGATKEEILEVLEMVTTLGIHSVTQGVPILEEEYNKFLAAKETKKKK